METNTADMTEMSTASTEKLLNAPAKALDSWLKTVRNCIKAARRDGQTRYIGHTALGYFIETDEKVAAMNSIRFVATADAVYSA